MLAKKQATQGLKRQTRNTHGPSEIARDDPTAEQGSCKHCVTKKQFAL